MLWVSEHADSSWERAPRCEEVIGARHMTFRHHWRLQLTPEGLTSWHNPANNSINLCSILVILTSIERSFQASWFWLIESLLTCLILEISHAGHKKINQSTNWSLTCSLPCCFQISKIRTLASRIGFLRYASITHAIYSARRTHTQLSVSASHVIQCTQYRIMNIW